MTAREQAREAVRKRLSTWLAKPTPSEVADVASDVWEPLLRDLLVAYEHAVENGGQGHRLDTLMAWGGYTRAKEALGGS